jgi:hypothetical protein
MQGDALESWITQFSHRAVTPSIAAQPYLAKSMHYHMPVLSHPPPGITMPRDHQAVGEFNATQYYGRAHISL